MVRPTPDRLREALFSVLAPRLEGTVFLDAYAGSGAVGIEALSRGAGRVILIEKNAAAIAVIEENLKSLGVRERVQLVRGAAGRMLPKLACDMAFVDPPYNKPQEYEESMGALDRLECGLVIAQHESRHELGESYGDLKKVRVLRQGDNSLSFYER